MMYSMAESDFFPQISHSNSEIDNMEDDSLFFQKVKEGDEASFEMLFKKYYVRLTHFAYTYVKDQAEAEELVQNTFVRIWEKRENIHLKVSFKSYLYQAVRNGGLNHVRNVKNKKSHLTVISSRDHDLPNAENDLNVNDIKYQLYQALENLPPRCKRIFQMSRLEGMKHSEIAKYLDLKTKTIENQIGIALKYLRIELSEYLHILILLSLTIIS